MTISTEEKYLLNNKKGKVANKVQLGTLIQNAESVTAGEIAVAENKVLIGSAAGVGAAQTISGDATLVAAGTLTIAAGAVGLTKLAAAVAPSHVVKFAGKHTTLGGDATEVITVTGLLTTDVVHVTVQTAGATPRSIVASVLTADTITVTLSGDPSTDHILAYSALRATA
jgi:hypothetical protein